MTIADSDIPFKELLCRDHGRPNCPCVKSREVGEPRPLLEDANMNPSSFGKKAIAINFPIYPTRYVVGFAFYNDEVLLIRKARPKWQEGKLNGVGGHIEPNELPMEAMAREFREEVGLEAPFWEHFATLVGNDGDSSRNAGEGTPFEVYFFTAQVDTTFRYEALIEPAPTDESIGWYWTDSLPDDVLPNLRWLVPLAFYAHRADWPLLITEKQGGGILRVS